MSLNINFRRKPPRPVLAMLSLAALLAVVALGASGTASNANVLGYLAAPPAPASQGQATDAQDTQDAREAQARDGFDQLPLGQQARSMSALVSAGLVHPQPITPIGKAIPRQFPQPNIPIVWGLERCTSCPTDANEPAASMHPTDPLYALVSGNFSVDRTTDGGLTWGTRQPVWPSGSGDVVNAWLPTSPNQDWALGASLNGGTPCITEGRTTDRGTTWATVSSNICTTGFFNDREYLFADQEPSSPFYGRVYLTKTLFDSAGSGSYNAVGVKFTSDMGTTWSPLVVHHSGSIGGVQGNRQYGSIAFQNGGAVVMGWMDSICCGNNPTLGGNFNKYHWARSTNGGVTFPVTGTIATDTRGESVAFNGTGPAGFRWSNQINVGADPANGTLYAVWLKFRTPGTPQGSGAATAFARSTDNGATWSSPRFLFNDPSATVTQYMPWVIASRDGTVHAHYSSSQAGAPTSLAHYYVQSTDRGDTWTAPFQLSSVAFNSASFMGDYNAIHVGAYGATASVISSWTDNRSAQRRHWARIGTFAQGTPTPTFTGTPPTFTPTRTRTNTPPASPTACAVRDYVSTDVPKTICDVCTVTSTLTVPDSGTIADVDVRNLNITHTYINDLIITLTSPDGTVATIWDRACGGDNDIPGVNFDDEASGAIVCPPAAGATYQPSSPLSILDGHPANGRWVLTVSDVAAIDFGTLNAWGLRITVSGGCGTPGTPGTPTATPTCAPLPPAWITGPNHPANPGIVRAVGVYFPPNGKLYSMGGRTSDAAGSDTTNPYEYTPGTPGSWVTKAAVYPDTQVNNMACGVLAVSGTSYIYCVGGSAALATTATARVFFYNPATDAITTLTAADNWPGNTGGTILPGGFAVVSNKLYIVGGFNISTAMINQVWQFDPTAAVGSKWLQRANLPVERGYVPAAAVGGIIYTAGGSLWDGTTLQDTSDSYKYDPVANTWTTIASIPRLTGETRAVTVGSVMWVLGGGRTAPNPSTQVDIYNPGSNTWSTGSPFSTARRNFPADSDGSRVWLAGGYAPTSATNTMEVYRPAIPCGTPVATPTNTVTPTRTNTQPAVNTPTFTRTNTPSNTPTRGSPTATSTAGSPAATRTFTATSTPGSPVPTDTPCPIHFTDVFPTDYFYIPVQYLYCRGVISGYADGTFRPYNLTTRAQLAKIIVLAEGWPIYTPPTPTFVDVPANYPFYGVIETAYNHNIISGYNCGGPGEPCPGLYYRPGNNVTRAQLCKIIVLAENWEITPPVTPTFRDVPREDAFYGYIETAYAHGIISGYNCGTGCLEFRPGNNATRGQICKIVYLAVTSPLNGEAVTASTNK